MNLLSTMNRLRKYRCFLTRNKVKHVVLWLGIFSLLLHSSFMVNYFVGISSPTKDRKIKSQRSFVMQSEGSFVMQQHTSAEAKSTALLNSGTGVFTCEYPKGTPATKLVMSIKLTFRGPGGTVLAITPVEVLAQPPVKKKLAICLGRVYSVPYCDDCTGLNYTYHLPEWMEYQKMMGVDTVFAYNVSMGPDATKIFKHYAEQGFVEVLSHRAVHNETYMPVSLGSIECLVRNKYSYEYVFMTDMDEFLIFDPKWDNFNDMIRDLFAHGDPTKQHKYFAMNQFITGEKEVEEKLKDSKAVPYLKTDRYREFHYDGYQAGKSIVNPRYCQHATAHECAPYNLNERVDPSLASIHHYKPCSMREADSKAECYTHLQNMTHSDGAQIFQKRLKRNVEQAFHDMHLWGF